MLQNGKYMVPSFGDINNFVHLLLVSYLHAFWITNENLSEKSINK